MFTFIKATVLAVLLSAATVPVRAETVLEEIRQTGVLKIAIREDAPPFGYLNANNNLQGYCLGFFSILRDRLQEELNRPLAVRLLRSSAANRFDLVANRLAYLECGPNTIISELPANIAFSTAFYLTGTQFLVRQEESLDLSELDEVTIGVLGDTSTEELIKQQYPQAEIETFSGVMGRTRGVQAVRQGKIAAFASDGILLRGEAEQQNFSFQQYLLIPEPPLTCDRYGMILPADNPQWQSFVNSVIASKPAMELFNDWFGRVINYGETEDNC